MRQTGDKGRKVLAVTTGVRGGGFWGGGSGNHNARLQVAR